MIRVVATVIAKPDSIEAVKRALLTLAAASRKEPECASYEILQDHSAPHEFLTLEEWKTGAGIDAHMKTPHVAAAVGAVGALLGAPLQIKRYVQAA